MLTTLVLAVGAITATSFLMPSHRIELPAVSPQATSWTHPVLGEPTRFRDVDDLQPQTLNELLDIPKEQLRRVDIARMNLLCATGLPGAEDLDVEAMLDRLDAWSRQIAVFTDNSLPDFYSRPHDFKNSEAHFRTLLVFSVLQLEYGVHYQEDGLDVNYDSANYPLLVGMLTGEAGGNCASMPVMYTAVGRRLGYPMSILLGKTHIFARWDGTAESGGHATQAAYRERFNIEGTNIVFNSHSDEHYRQWPYPISDAEIAEGWYLKPLTPVEELAVFLSIRGHVFLENGRYREALHAFSHSYRLAPQNPYGEPAIIDSQMALKSTLRGQGLPQAAMARGGGGRIGSDNMLADIDRRAALLQARYPDVHLQTARRMHEIDQMIQNKSFHAGRQSFSPAAATPTTAWPARPQNHQP